MTVACLESNVDSKNIRILASLQKPLYSSEVDDYFKRCMKDLGWTIPERGECLFAYARDLARQILANDVSPQDGYRKICDIATALNYPQELKSWIYLHADMESWPQNDVQEAEWENTIRNEAASLARL